MYQTTHWWHWLTYGNGFPNAVALQALTGAVSAMAAIAAGVFAYRAYKATRSQFELLKKQTEYAKAQAEAATAQLKLAIEAATEQKAIAQKQMTASAETLEAARKQSELLAMQLEQATSPLLVVEPDDRPHMRGFKLVNRGPGVAFKIMYWQGGLEPNGPDRPHEAILVNPSTLAPGVPLYINVVPALDVITVRYKGIDRQFRWTTFYKDTTKPQEHVVQKALQRHYLS